MSSMDHELAQHSGPNRYGGPFRNDGQDDDVDPRRSRWIPWAIVGGFLLVIAVNGVMLALALGSFNGLATDGAYDRGLTYNRTLDEVAAQNARGWQVAIGATRVPGDSTLQMLVSATVSDRDGAPFDDATVTATLRRPIHEGFDIEANLAAVGDGRYEATVDLPLAGLWEIRVEIDHGDDHHRAEHRLVVE